MHTHIYTEDTYKCTLEGPAAVPKESPHDEITFSMYLPTVTIEPIYIFHTKQYTCVCASIDFLIYSVTSVPTAVKTRLNSINALSTKLSSNREIFKGCFYEQLCNTCTYMETLLSNTQINNYHTLAQDLHKGGIGYEND